jgi:hypothetical protein
MLFQIQYQAKQFWKGSAMSPFLRLPVSRIRYKCSGIKVCENIHPDLKNLHHFEVSDDIWSKIKDIRGELRLDDADVQKYNAIT